MNKNAYEIRLDVLQMEHNDAWTEYNENMQEYRMRNDTLKPGEYKKAEESFYPNSKDIIKRAEELYVFINNN